MGSNPSSVALRHSFKAFTWFFIWSSHAVNSQVWVPSRVQTRDLWLTGMSAASRVQRLLVRSQPDLCDMNEWCGVSEGCAQRRGIPVRSPPGASGTMSSSGYAFDQMEKILFNCIKCRICRPFPTYLGCQHLLFKGVTLQKENDGNLHIQYQTTHTINYNHLSMSRYPSLRWMSTCPRTLFCPNTCFILKRKDMYKQRLHTVCAKALYISKNRSRGHQLHFLAFKDLKLKRYIIFKFK